MGEEWRQFNEVAQLPRQALVLLREAAQDRAAALGISIHYVIAAYARAICVPPSALMGKGESGDD